MDLEVVDRVVLDVELVVAEASPGVVVREVMELQESHHRLHTSQVRLRTQVEVEKMREEAEVANEAATLGLKEAARNSRRPISEVGIKAVVQVEKTRRRRSRQVGRRLKA